MLVCAVVDIFWGLFAMKRGSRLLLVTVKCVPGVVCSQEVNVRAVGSRSGQEWE